MILYVTCELTKDTAHQWRPAVRYLLWVCWKILSVSFGGLHEYQYRFTLPDHGDVMIWKCCPHYQPFVQGIHQSLVLSYRFPSQRVVIWSFGIFFYISLNALFNNSQIPCDKRCHGVTHIDGLMQERRNSIANALELHLSCTNPSVNMTAL